jgi:hypothetical protein
MAVVFVLGGRMRSIPLVFVCLAIAPGAALADSAVPAPPATTAAAAPPPAAAAPAPAEDGMSLRNGFSVSAGEEFGSGPSSGLNGQLFGADWRIGARINADYAVYAHSHLSFGTAHIGAASGVTGNFAAALLAERSLPARTFVAAGGGYGVLNNPSGPLAQARVGWYPMEQANDRVLRRLNVALDARWYFAGEAIGTVTQIALTLGYDRF